MAIKLTSEGVSCLDSHTGELSGWEVVLGSINYLRITPKKASQKQSTAFPNLEHRRRLSDILAIYLVVTLIKRSSWLCPPQIVTLSKASLIRIYLTSCWQCSETVFYSFDWVTQIQESASLRYSLGNGSENRYEVKEPMAEERVKRKLSAIPCVDVVGYSRLMGEGEAATLNALNTCDAETMSRQ